MSGLNSKHLEDLRKSTLTDETIDKYGIVPLSEAELHEKLGRSDISGGGLFFPYPNSHCFRIKPDCPRVIKRKGKKDQIIKYENPFGMILDLYITETAKNAFKDITIPLYWTEGEKKCLALEQLGFAAIGLPGVDGWSRDKQVGKPLIDLLIAGHENYIVFDSDKINKEPVLKAEARFAEVLNSLGGKIKVVNLPYFDSATKGVDDQILFFTNNHNLHDLKDILTIKAIPFEEYTKKSIRNSQENTGTPLTDVWNAELLVSLHGENIKWCAELGGWFTWNGKAWLRDKRGAVERFAKNTVKEMLKSKDKEIVKHGKTSESLGKLRAMIELSKSENNTTLTAEDFDQEGFLLNCNNGMLDLSTGKLFQHERSKYCTRLVKIDYDPQAQCPTWEWFLNDIFFNNTKLIKFLQKAIGYSLTNSIKEQCFFIFYGIGQNGKSTFLGRIKKLLNDYAAETPVSTLMAKRDDKQGPTNDVARLCGRRFVVSFDSNQSRSFNEGIIKKLTGQDEMSARFLFQEAFEFLPTFKIFLATNHKPKIIGTDFGIWRRIKLIPFNRLIKKEEKDVNLDTKLEAELPGILRWAIEGCLEWQKEGLGDVEEIEQATQEYKEEEDFIGNFIKENCTLEESYRQTLSSVLYESFKEWAKSNGEFYISQKEFNRYLEGRGLKKAQRTFGPDKGRMFWAGIRLVGENAPSTGEEQVAENRDFIPIEAEQ